MNALIVSDVVWTKPPSRSAARAPISSSRSMYPPVSSAGYSTRAIASAAGARSAPGAFNARSRSAATSVVRDCRFNAYGTAQILQTASPNAQVPGADDAGCQGWPPCLSRGLRHGCQSRDQFSGELVERCDDQIRVAQLGRGIGIGDPDALQAGGLWRTRSPSGSPRSPRTRTEEARCSSAARAYGSGAGLLRGVSPDATMKLMWRSRPARPRIISISCRNAPEQMPSGYCRG